MWDIAVTLVAVHAIGIQSVFGVLLTVLVIPRPDNRACLSFLANAS